METFLPVISILCSAATVLVTAIYNIYKQHSENVYKDRTFLYEYKANVIEQFIKSASSIIITSRMDKAIEFGEACGEIYSYTEKEQWEKIETIITAIFDILNNGIYSDMDKSSKEQIKQNALSALKELSQYYSLHPIRTLDYRRKILFNISTKIK